VEHDRWKRKHPEDFEFLKEFDSLAKPLHRELVEAKSRKAPNIEALKQEWRELWERKAGCEQRQRELLDEWDKTISSNTGYRLVLARTVRLEKAIETYRNNPDVRYMMSGVGWNALEQMQLHLDLNYESIRLWESRQGTQHERPEPVAHWQDGI
jgi:hypothetical protein